MAERAQIVVKGVVQGVGFRPYIFNLAESLGLKGYVTNTSEGVVIDAEGDQLSEFVARLRSDAPPLSQITDIFVTNLPPHGYSKFSIRKSIGSAAALPFTLVSPDVSICPDCFRELFDRSDRRFLYPFINCTNCGPRYSITQSVPYDRPNTTMANFIMCPNCQKEYDDPRNRRFHAQPNACADCGPSVELRFAPARKGSPHGGEERGKVLQDGEAISETIRLLKQGRIVAVKGIGGFHIACDATNDEAVRQLRVKKRKSNKPFAVMAPSIDVAATYSHVSDVERQALESIRRPVVLLRKRGEKVLSRAVSPNNQFVGVMLPYTPLHYLLFFHPARTSLIPSVSLYEEGFFPRPHFRALVMTSGNLSEEPIVRDNDEAVRKLGDIADAFLVHDRDIFMRVDDSVIRVPDPGSETGRGDSNISFLRRSRGYAPDPIELRDEGPEVLGCGADLKNTFAVTKGRFVIPGQHIGDMENYETLTFFEESLANIKTVYRANPQVVAHDLHPGYASTKWARESGLEAFGIQHHYAHIGSVMAENGLREKVIGVAFDGTGYGTDGTLWGSEFLIADVEGFERVAHFRSIPLPGGESAIREPWKTAVSLVMQSTGTGALKTLEQTGFLERYGIDVIKQVMKIASSDELSPRSCGAGRLFDAVAALIGICDRNTFEGEAAMALESFTRDSIEDDYPVEFKPEKGYTVVDFSSAIAALIRDKADSVPSETISTKFHNTVAAVVRKTVVGLRDRHDIGTVALSGGTFQNLYILTRIVKGLTAEGLQVLVNRKVPCNDGGISLGQAYIVRERLKNRRNA